jgi:alcohol dehydrogenase class IV
VKFVEGMEALSRACGLPQNLHDVGIEKEALPMLARDAMNQSRLLVNNPRPVDEAEALAIYEAAW